MAKKPRLEFESAFNHVIGRRDYRKNLFLERRAAPAFEKALLDACAMMSDHLQLAIETPAANLMSGTE